MFTFSLAEAFITLFIGMGPIKVLLIYIAKTQNMELDVRRQVARRTVIVAASVAVFGGLVAYIVHAHILPAVQRWAGG